MRLIDTRLYMPLRAALLLSLASCTGPIGVNGNQGPETACPPTEGILNEGTQPVGCDSETHQGFTNGVDMARESSRRDIRQGTFWESENCEGCHSDYREGDEPMHEPWDTWAGSMMAHAGRDPLFWAALDISNQDNEALAKAIAHQQGVSPEAVGDPEIGGVCLRCHTPRAWYEGRARNPTAYGATFDGQGLQGELHESGGDFSGVSCSFCHRMVDGSQDYPYRGFKKDSGAPHTQNGFVTLSPQRRLMEGPYAKAQPQQHRFDVTPTRNIPGESKLLGEEQTPRFFKQSSFCGQCHDVTHPALGLRDAETGAMVMKDAVPVMVPIERTYTEWQQSDFARAPEGPTTCQDCHMAAVDTDGDGAPGPARSAKPKGEESDAPLRPMAEGADAGLPVRAHSFRGPGVWMLQVLKELYGDSLDRQASFDNAIAESRVLMQDTSAGPLSGAVDVAVELGPQGDSLPVSVTVTNRAGHKFPTGYAEGRDSWLALEVWEDADGDGRIGEGERVHLRRGDKQIGGPEDGRFPSGGEALRHYTVRLGEVHDGHCTTTDEQGRDTFHFVLTDCIAHDSRIPARGMRADASTAPKVGAEGPVYAVQDDGGLAHWDTVQLDVPLPADAGAVSARAVVYYQTTTREYVDFLHRSNESHCDPLDNSCTDPTDAAAGSCDVDALIQDPDRRFDREALVGCNRGQKMAVIFAWGCHGAAECDGPRGPEHLAVGQALAVAAAATQGE